MARDIPSLILGYHGCDAAIADGVFAGERALQSSGNDYDWLGDGIYFWEHSAQRAHDWAVQRARQPDPSGQKIRDPAVIGAVIDPGRCLNLLDAHFIALVRQAYLDLAAAARAADLKLPRNSGGPDRLNRKLDCAVIRLLHAQQEDAGAAPFDTVRAAFFEGGDLYPTSGFAKGNHIQVCVRDHRQIAGYFRPLDARGRPLRFHA